MPINDFTKPPPFEGGGGGLVSAAADYARFCADDPERRRLDVVRVLSPVSVALMSTNVVPDAVGRVPAAAADWYRPGNDIVSSA